MGKSEKLVVLSVLLVVVLLFVWSLQSGPPTEAENGNGSVYASERDSVTGPRMNERAPRSQRTTPGPAADPSGSQRGTRSNAASRLQKNAGGVDAETAAAGISTQPGSPRMLLAETGGAGNVDVQVNDASRRRAASSTLADPAAGARTGPSSRTGAPAARVRMQHGWDLVTTAGLVATVDPAMFLYEVKGEGRDVTWQSLAKDLYGDTAKEMLLRHNNEGLAEPVGQIFVPARDDLGGEATVRTVEVLQGESLWQVAKRTLGKGSEWKAVYEANRNVIADPDFVAPGTILTIPVR
ncbi:MAG: LysM peptidoglycan-binding domain-containing protein [Planctomycetota bacterium]